MPNAIKSIRKEFHKSPEARYIHRLHAVLLVLLGLSTVRAGKLLGDPQRTISHWAIQFNKHGLAGLKDLERPGRPERLNDMQKKSLKDALAKSPQAFGLKTDGWTGHVVSQFINKEYAVKLSARQCERLTAAFKKQPEA